ncbi:MAG TPA: MerR family transcriptional regulator [Longilinea sp.]|nr:MerR family transcriptional regulator [Longilinea sp.]
MNNQNPDDEGMMISELARKANVSVRTIRFYIAEGLLPAPQPRGRFSLYDEDALLRLQVIRYLKDAFLPLREIRERMAGLSTGEVRDLLSTLEQTPSAQNSAHISAVDYIDQLTMRNQAPRARMAESEKQFSPALPSRAIPLIPQPRPVQQAEKWRHYHIAPGIIVLATESMDRAAEKKLEELLKFASTLFSSQGVRNA